MSDALRRCLEGERRIVREGRVEKVLPVDRVADREIDGIGRGVDQRDIDDDVFARELAQTGVPYFGRVVPDVDFDLEHLLQVVHERRESQEVTA